MLIVKVWHNFKSELERKLLKRAKKSVTVENRVKMNVMKPQLHLYPPPRGNYNRHHAILLTLWAVIYVMKTLKKLRDFVWYISQSLPLFSVRFGVPLASLAMS